MQVKAKVKFVKISPKKMRLVVDLIRGLDVEKALEKLSFTNKVAAKPIIKLLESAISNAEENLKLQRNNLLIGSIQVDAGPVLKRWRPRAFGRATPIRKRSSHVLVVLDEKVPTKKKAVKKTVKKDDDLVKIDNIDDLKKIDKEASTDKDGKGVSDRPSRARPKGSKGFVGKIFNRKSGEK